ncbi:MAG TPA: DUF1844 domain-containing protein [Armatimonadota bacterium]|jgi:hypothetical protein
MESDENTEVAQDASVHANNAPPEPAADEGVSTDEGAPQMPPIDVYGLLKTTVSLLSNGAWAWMGLTPSPFTGEMDRDLDQAKVAIDSVTYLVAQIESHLDDESRREMQNVVSMLRVNYVQQLSNR